MKLPNVKRRTEILGRRVRAVGEWRRLARLRSEGGDLGRLARGLLWGRNPDPTAAENHRFHAIEARRWELLASDQQVTFVDFGAISPDANLSESEMMQGSTRTIPLAQVARASKPQSAAMFLYGVVREFAPRTVIEMDTCVGISGSYILAAMRAAGSDGNLVTMEGGESVAKIADETFHGLGFDGVEIVVGRHQDTLGTVLAAHSPVQFAFVDGDHGEGTTLSYHDRIVDAAADRAVIFHDDIRWSAGMTRMWDRLCNSERAVRAVVDLYGVGVCLVDKHHVGKPELFRLYMD